LDDQTLQSPLQRKAMARLMGLRFKISYKKGVDNGAADALSRVGHLMVIQQCSEVRFSTRMSLTAKRSVV
jgi:phosphoribosylformylglycinamidine (FGAM) synthase PurS component